MTRQRSFKRLVRARMEKTGESYAAARASLLGAEQPRTAAEPAPLATSDAGIRERTGRGWEEWFDLLDEWGAADRSHRDIARWVADELGIDPLVWEAQAVTMSYERARRGREIGEKADGFTITASKTVAVPVEPLYEAFVEERRDANLRERTATKPRSARFDWGDGPTRVNVTFVAKGEARSTVAVEHARLADAAEAERMKAFWRERLAALKAELEGGARDA
ncbi:MAG TPA: hypothetical protein VGW10_07460 [Solirubrobacteraceae bacterium]|nr:hypothetical protein [Solirubrobacteraceae bacterium]